MKIKELTNWMKETFEQGNGVIAVSAGQGGSGAELVMKELGETLIADVAMYDDTEISIVEDATEIEEVGIMIDHLDQLSNYDAVVKLANDDPILFHDRTKIGHFRGIRAAALHGGS